MHVALLWLLSLPAAAWATRLGARRYAIDLDRQPEERWREVVEDHRDILPALLVGFEMQLWQPGIKGEDGEPGKEAVRPRLGEKFWMRYHNLGAEQLAELVGIVRLADHPDVTLRRLVFYQILLEPYEEDKEVSRFTTTGVVTCNANGTVLHGRSIAYGFRFIARGRRMHLGEFALDLTFKRGGQPLFSAVGFPGRIGVVSGMVLQGSTPVSVTCYPTGFSSNRFLKEDEPKLGGIPLQLAVREALEANLGFRGTVDYLMRRHLSFDSSYTVAGPGPCEAALVHTMGHAYFKSEAHTQEFFLSKTGIEFVDPKIGQWYMAKKNNHDMALETDVGRMLDEISRERLTPAALMSVMQRLPVPQLAVLSVDSPGLGAQASLFKWA